MSSLTERTSIAKEIYTTYIRNEAPQEINIDHALKVEIAKGVDKASVDLFDKALDEIESLLTLDVVPKFKR
jgi:hypothetical protein